MSSSITSIALLAISGLVLFLYAASRLALLLRLAGQADVARQIAHAHVLFNVAGVLLFPPLLPLCQRLFDAWLPDQNAEARLAPVPAR